MSRGLPVFCPHCGHLFESPIFRIADGSQNITITGSPQFVCERCGKLAHGLSGAYSVVDETLAVLAASPLTSQKVQRLNALRGKLSQSETITEDLIDALSAVTPEIGAMARSLRDKKWGKAILIGALAIAAARCSGGGPTITFDFSRDTYVTQIVNEAPVTRIEDTALYYPNHTKEQQAGDDAKPTANGPKAEKEKP